MPKHASNIETLITGHQQKLLGYLLRKTRNPQVAQDLLQETLISALDAYPSFKNKSSFLTWLCGIANHEIADYYRKKKIKTVLFSLFPFLEDLAEQAFGPEQQLLKIEIEQETEKRVRYVLTKLNEGYAEILRLRYYQHLTIGQIAKKLNASYKAVESKLSRARKAFAQTYLADHSQGNLPVLR